MLDKFDTKSILRDYLKAKNIPYDFDDTVFIFLDTSLSMFYGFDRALVERAYFFLEVLAQFFKILGVNVEYFTFNEKIFKFNGISDIYLQLKNKSIENAGLNEKNWDNILNFILKRECSKKNFIFSDFIGFPLESFNEIFFDRVMFVLLEYEFEGSISKNYLYRIFNDKGNSFYLNGESIIEFFNDHWKRTINFFSSKSISHFISRKEADIDVLIKFLDIVYNFLFKGVVNES